MRQDAGAEAPAEVPWSPGGVSGPSLARDLARVVAAWGDLPEAIKAGILALVDAATE